MATTWLPGAASTASGGRAPPPPGEALAVVEARTPTSTGSASGAPRNASKRASHRRSSRIRRIRRLSRSMRSKACRSASGSRSPARARLVWASITETGVRQLVGGVGAELQLTLPRPLDRRGDAAADGHRTQEDEASRIGPMISSA